LICVVWGFRGFGVVWGIFMVLGNVGVFWVFEGWFFVGEIS